MAIHKININGVLIHSERDLEKFSSQYLVGKKISGILYLNCYEFFFLASRGYFSKEFNDVFFNNCKDFEERKEFFIFYSRMKFKGNKIMISGDEVYFAKRDEKSEDAKKVYPVMEDTIVNRDKLKKFHDGTVCSIDYDGEFTYYKIKRSTINELDKINKLNEKQINDMEWMGFYDGHIKIFSKNENNIIEKRNAENEEFKIYKDLLEKGFIIKSGFKFGSTFRLYRESMNEHSEFLVNIFEEKMPWYHISRAVRVSGSVRKKMVFCWIEGDDPVYYEIERIKV
ncbi:tRNA-intron lyase [Caldiplasma sukawensis]